MKSNLSTSRRKFLKQSAQTAIVISLPTIVPASVFGKFAPSNRINVGAIGNGRISRTHDMPGVWKHDIAKIMAVCDLDANRAEDGKKLINEYYAKSKIFIAPMLIGTGLQNKLLEAMAMQLPCITSPLVNNSLGAKADTEILIAENANAYAAYVFRLLEDDIFAKSISKAGYEFVTTNFSWSNTIEELNDIFLKITR